MNEPPREIQDLSPPTILFRTESVPEGGNSFFQTVEFVQKDQALVQLTNSSEPGSINRTELIQGNHTQLSEDKTTLLASIDGYPLLSKRTERNTTFIRVDMKPIVSITHDKMTASVTLYPPVSGSRELKSARLDAILRDNGVQLTPPLSDLDSLLIRCREEKALLRDIPVAQGLLPSKGTNSFLRFLIEIGPLPGKLMGNGKIDYRERKMFVGVSKGDIIATNIPPTSGTPGINVCGEEIPQIPGKDLPVEVLKDAEYDKKSRTIRATRGGILSLVRDNSIMVCAKQIISGNIDYSTGNIESHNAVEINGTILPGFSVKTQGDLLLNGNARAASIRCDANLVIKGGIIGEQCKVTVKGDADITFMDQGRLRSKGKVIIREHAYHSRIMADGEIHARESSQVMAGVLMSGKSLFLGNVGSPSSPPALLAAAVAPGRYLRFLSMREKLRETEQERLGFLKRFGLQKNVSIRQSLEDAIETLHRDMTQLNLIPGTPPTSHTHGKNSFAEDITITIHGTIFSGTEVHIGNTTKTLERDRSAICLSLDTGKGTIIESPL